MLHSFQCHTRTFRFDRLQHWQPGNPSKFVGLIGCGVPRQTGKVEFDDVIATLLHRDSASLFDGLDDFGIIWSRRFSRLDNVRLTFVDLISDRRRRLLLPATGDKEHGDEKDRQRSHEMHRV
ncbi:MAG: hypothetical protein R3C05_20735 [Pirellulaceae bacterium]